ncbi:hypothetical protein C0J52_08665 [Blattella germanica]|nr:hypothetical protein C0J52_08665 [Blattella germanica]
MVTHAPAIQRQLQRFVKHRPTQIEFPAREPLVDRIAVSLIASFTIDFFNSQVGDSSINTSAIRLKKHTKPASPEAMRHGSKAPRLEITVMPTVTNVYMLQTINPRYLGSASSSTSTCNKHCEIKVARTLLENPSIILPQINMVTLLANMIKSQPIAIPIFPRMFIFRRPQTSIATPHIKHPIGDASAYTLAKIWPFIDTGTLKVFCKESFLNLIVQFRSNEHQTILKLSNWHNKTHGLIGNYILLRSTNIKFENKSPSSIV